MKKLILLATALSFVNFNLHAEDAKPKPKFVPNGYTHAENEVEPTDWANPDVLEWCSDVSKLRANCLRLIPSESKIENVNGKDVISMPIRSHLYFSDTLDGTIYYYGVVQINPLTLEATVLETEVVLDMARTRYSKTGEGFNRVTTGLGEPESYRTKMEALLKDYFGKSAFLKNLMQTDYSLKKLSEVILSRTQKPAPTVE